MPTPPKSDPFLLYRIEQLEADYVPKNEYQIQLQGIQKSIDSLRDEVESFKKSILSAFKWIGGLFVTAILTGLVGIAVAWFTRGF